jgi:hypothetical protein
MRKALIIVIALEVIIFFLILPFLNYYYTNASYSEYHDSIALIPKDDNIKIFCLEDNKKIDCTERTTFNCGEKIQISAKFSNLSYPFYACVDMSSLDIPFFCTNKTLWSTFMFYEPGITIPNISGETRFIDIYWFPPKDYKSLEDFTADIASSKVVSSLSRYVTC